MIIRIKKRHFLRSSDIKKVIEVASKNFKGINIDLRGSEVELMVLETNDKLYLVGGMPFMVTRSNNITHPTLIALQKGVISLEEVTVDRGAVPYVLRGADVMVPGIIKFPKDVERGRIVAVKGEDLASPIAVGITLMDYNEFSSSNKGKAVKNIHHLGDKLWKFYMGLQTQQRRRR
ncbi:MAG: DUF1947 domain-containing protein [Candidatus Baldrarchaeia archaeon]